MFHVISARQAFSLVLSVLPFHLVKPFQAKQTLLQQHCALPPGSRSRQPGLGQRASTAKPPMGIGTGWGRLLPALHCSLQGLCPPDTPRATWQGSPAPQSPRGKPVCLLQPGPLAPGACMASSPAPCCVWQGTRLPLGAAQRGDTVNVTADLRG